MTPKPTPTLPPTRIKISKIPQILEDMLSHGMASCAAGCFMICCNDLSIEDMGWDEPLEQMNNQLEA